MPRQRTTPKPKAPTRPHGTCASCFFSVLDSNNIRTCCFYPPAWQRSRPSQHFPVPDALVNNWPIVTDTDWCGHGYDTVNGAWNTPDGKPLNA